MATKVLAILLSKQVDLRIDGGEDTRIIFPCYDAIDSAVRQGGWTRVVTNSRIIAAAFGLPVIPRKFCWTLQDVHPLVLSASHVLCFHAGGPKFRRVLDAIRRVERKHKAYLVDLEDGDVSRQ